MESIDELYDSMRDTANEYIKGAKNRRGERHVRALMLMAIEHVCGIHAKGIEVGGFNFRSYNREIKHRKKYWERVRNGEITDTRRGFDTERGTDKSRKSLNTE